jgi:hypothetical protein
MKILVSFLFLIGILLPLSCSKKFIQSATDTKYLLKEIQKKNTWYILYAEKKDTLYKIISRDENPPKERSEKLLIGNYYTFQLQSYYEKTRINGALIPVGFTGCHKFDRETAICLEPQKGIFDLYFASNLKGIYFLK